MSADDNKKLMLLFLEETNAALGDIIKIRSLYEKYCLPNFIHHDPSGGETNMEQRIMSTSMAFAAFPDAKYYADDIIAEGDKVVTRYTLQATHKEPFMGVPPTGKQMIIRGVNIYRIENGKCAEAWEFMDRMGMMVQVGAVLTFPTSK